MVETTDQKLTPQEYIGIQLKSYENVVSEQRWGGRGKIHHVFLRYKTEPKEKLLERKKLLEATQKELYGNIVDATARLLLTQATDEEWKETLATTINGIVLAETGGLLVSALRAEVRISQDILLRTLQINQDKSRQKPQQ